MSNLAEADSADSAATVGSAVARLLRDRSGLQRVTNIELFFDLVYVFAVTQLSRALLWLGAVCVDLLGGVVGFYTPGLGRSRTSDWTIEGGHFAERCQAFVLIALGESIVVIGATLGDKPATASNVTAFVVAFVGAVALWWLYFDQSAEAAVGKIARSDDPGRLGRSAYHLIHPVMVAGIIVSTR